MKTIWKFPLEIKDLQLVPMPVGAKIVHVGNQDEELCVWAIVDPQAPLEDRAFRIAGTGHVLREGGRHTGSVIMAGGALVWHIFEPAAGPG